MSYLALVRHGESEWNEKGLWTGWTDVPLTSKGKEQARQAAEVLKDIKFDASYTSKLERAKHTLEEIEEYWGCTDCPSIEDAALNERNYGDFTGKNKWEVQKQVGEEKFQKIRRGWDEAIPNGETLKNVYNRVIPYYEKNILPNIKAGENVLVVAHGNTDRALIKYLENISDDDIAKVELELGEIYLYQMDNEGKVISKQIRKVKES